jgi:uncharacterized membrane protein YeaQ/YmgE (transglycosylase-associated protein family)
MDLCLPGRHDRAWEGQMGESGGSAGVPVSAERTRCVAGVVVAIVLGVVGATFGSWFGSTHTPVMSTEEAMVVSRAALGDVSPPVSVERVNKARPFAYHGDVVVAG